MDASSDHLQVVTLGEALVALTPVPLGPLRTAAMFQKHLGGAELNVAVGLSRRGVRVGWAGWVGDDDFGHQIYHLLRGEGVDVSRAVLVEGGFTGLYLRERRASGQVRVRYYRSGSAASRLAFSELDVDYLLSGDLLHLTGITAGLSSCCHDAVARLLTEANRRGVMVSFDVNVRSQVLAGRDAAELLLPIIEHADWLFLSDGEAELLLGGSGSDAIRQARRRMRAETIVVHSAEGAVAVAGDEVAESPNYAVEAIDTVGAGDAFVAGYVAGRLQGLGSRECLALAHAAGACAVTVIGDVEAMPTLEEVASLSAGLLGIER